VPHRAILSTALEIKPDLIVMGLPTRSVLDTVFMGSTTSPVLRRAQCPVLTVPVPASIIESQTFMKSSRTSALDSDLYSMVPSRASQTNRIGGLASW
jgi:Universal stress protein family